MKRQVFNVLPDTDAVFWCEIEFVSRFNVEGVVPCVDIAHRVRPELRRGVRISNDLLAEGCIARFRAPVLAKGDKELLIA